MSLDLYAEICKLSGQRALTRYSPRLPCCSPVVRATGLRSRDHRCGSPHPPADPRDLPLSRLSPHASNTAPHASNPDLCSWIQGRSSVHRCVSSSLRSDSLCASWAFCDLSFLRPPVGVQVLGSFTKRVYHIQLIKAIIILNTFIAYRCVSSMQI